MHVSLKVSMTDMIMLCYEDVLLGVLLDIPSMMIAWLEMDDPSLD